MLLACAAKGWWTCLAMLKVTLHSHPLQMSPTAGPTCTANRLTMLKHWASLEHRKLLQVLPIWACWHCHKTEQVEIGKHSRQQLAHPPGSQHHIPEGRWPTMQSAAAVLHASDAVLLLLLHPYRRAVTSKNGSGGWQMARFPMVTS